MASTGAGRGGEVGYKTDDDVRSYVRKRKRANKNCSVSHLRRALNIGYKKAKRIHDEVDDELRRERHDRRGDEPRHPSRSNRASHDDDGSDDGVEFEDDSPHDRQAHDDEQDEGDIPDEALREHIRKKLRRGEVIYVHHMRDLGLSYRRTRRILQEFIDQGKIQKLPKSALGERSGSEANHTGASGGAAPTPTADDAVKMKPLKQKVKEENKKAAESQLKTDPDTEDKKDTKDEPPDAPLQEGGDKRTPPSATVRTETEVPSSPSSSSAPSPSSSSSSLSSSSSTTTSSSSSSASGAATALAPTSAATTPVAGSGAEQSEEEVPTREAAAPGEPAAQHQQQQQDPPSSGGEQGKEVLLVPPASGTAAAAGDDDMDTETQRPLHTPPHFAAQPPDASDASKTEEEGEERKPTILFMEESPSSLLPHSRPASETEPSSLASSAESSMDVVSPTAVTGHLLHQDESAHST